MDPAVSDLSATGLSAFPQAVAQVLELSQQRSQSWFPYNITTSTSTHICLLYVSIILIVIGNVVIDIGGHLNNIVGWYAFSGWVRLRAAGHAFGFCTNQHSSDDESNTWIKSRTGLWTLPQQRNTLIGDVEILYARLQVGCGRMSKLQFKHCIPLFPAFICRYIWPYFSKT